MPSNKEAAVRREVSAELRRATTPVELPALQDYVTRIGTVLGPQNTFTLVTTAQSNALHEPVALPDGGILIPVSLFLSAKNESEFAGMIAQAIARGPQLIAIKNTGGIPLIYVAGATDMMLPIAALDQRRTAELEADASAIPNLARAGFDPAGLLHYVDRMQPPDNGHSPFPRRDVRIAALLEAIRNLPATTYEQRDIFENLQQQLRPVLPGARGAAPSLRVRDH